MDIRLGPEALRPIMRRSWATTAVAGGLGALAQIPLFVFGLGPVLWSSFLGALALALALWVGRQTWRRSRAGPRLEVSLHGRVLSTQWAGEDREAISVGPDTQVSERMAWLMVQAGGGGVAIPLSSPGLKELKEALNKARFGDRKKTLRREDPLPPANDAVTPGPDSPEAMRGGGLDKAARVFAAGSLGTLALTVAAGLLVGFEAGFPLFGLFLVCAGGFLFIEKGLTPLRTGTITNRSPYSGSSTHTGGTAKFMAALNLFGSALLALLGVLLLVIGVGNLLS